MQDGELNEYGLTQEMETDNTTDGWFEVKLPLNMMGHEN
jgi:hypothetical protein